MYAQFQSVRLKIDNHLPKFESIPPMKEGKEFFFVVVYCDGIVVSGNDFDGKQLLSSECFNPRQSKWKEIEPTQQGKK